MDNRPVGGYDSGLGGLTVWRAIRRQLPEESLVYLGDGKNRPDGARPADEICRLADEAVGRLVGAGCKMVVVACNTATVLRRSIFWRSQISADAYRGDGTRREARLPEYPQWGSGGAGYGPESGRRSVPPHGRPVTGKNIRVLTAVGEGFVELVEESTGEQSPEAEEAVRRVLEPMIREGADQDRAGLYALSVPAPGFSGR